MDLESVNKVLRVCFDSIQNEKNSLAQKRRGAEIAVQMCGMLSNSASPVSSVDSTNVSPRLCATAG